MRLPTFVRNWLRRRRALAALNASPHIKLTIDVLREDLGMSGDELEETLRQVVGGLGGPPRPGATGADRYLAWYADRVWRHAPLDVAERMIAVETETIRTKFTDAERANLDTPDP